MRQPLEDGRVTISRAAGTMTFPSQFMLLAAMNPTPDGKMPGESRSSPREIQNYLGRISGPLLDRIDLHVEVPQVKFREIAGDRTGETSAQIRDRVVAARRRQHERFKHKPKITCNARMGTRELKTVLRTGRADEGIVEERDGGIEFQRAGLRPDFESGADHCGLGRVGKHFERPHFRGGSVSLAGPAIVDVRATRGFIAPIN